SRRRHTRFSRDWSSDVCSSDLVPWLRDHLEGEIQSFLGETDVDPMTVLERLREAAQTLVGGRPEGEEDDGGRSLVEIVQTPAQREILGRLTAVMSLLEGHADFVMEIG